MNEHLLFFGLGLMALLVTTTAILSGRTRQHRSTLTAKLIHDIKASIADIDEAVLDGWMRRLRRARTPERYLSRTFRIGAVLSAVLFVEYLLSNVEFGLDLGLVLPFLNVAAISLGAVFFMHWLFILDWLTRVRRARRS